MIALDSRNRAKIIWIATMCAPIAVVQGVRMLADTSPAPAAAAATDQAFTTLPAAQPITDRQREALRWLMDRGARLPTRSPMDRADPPQAAVADSQGASEPEQTPPPRPDDTPRNLRVTSIIGDGNRALAAINNRVRRVGEEIAPNWRIARIDSRARAVIVRHTDGREVRFEPPTGQ